MLVVVALVVVFVAEVKLSVVAVVVFVLLYVAVVLDDVADVFVWVSVVELVAV